MTAWSLTPAQREDVVQRLVSNICALAHVQGLELSAEVRKLFKFPQIKERGLIVAARRCLY